MLMIVQKFVQDQEMLLKIFQGSLRILKIYTFLTTLLFFICNPSRSPGSLWEPMPKVKNLATIA